MNKPSKKSPSFCNGERRNCMANGFVPLYNFLEYWKAKGYKESNLEESDPKKVEEEDLEKDLPFKKRKGPWRLKRILSKILKKIFKRNSRRLRKESLSGKKIINQRNLLWLLMLLRVWSISWGIKEKVWLKKGSKLGYDHLSQELARLRWNMNFLLWLLQNWQSLGETPTRYFPYRRSFVQSWNVLLIELLFHIIIVLILVKK